MILNVRIAAGDAANIQRARKTEAKSINKSW